MRVFILVDMEGGSGIHSFSLQTYADGRFNNTARRLVTQDTNAAIDGAFAGGATDAVVFDSHGSGTIDIEELDSRACVVNSGTPAPYGMDESFGAFFQVGQHAKAGSAGGVLCHSYCSRSIISVHLNGREVGEMAIRAAIAGALGIPFVLETGDRAACDEALDLVPDVETACVKTGFSQESALMLHPHTAQELIRERAKRAIERASEIEPFVMEPPYELQVSYLQEQRAFGLNRLPGVDRVDGRTVRATGDNLCALEALLL